MDVAWLRQKDGTVEREELEQLGIWERQVACSKLWGELTSPIYGLKDNKGRTPPQAKVRQAKWPGCWLYMDAEGYQLLDDEDMKRWVLVQGG